jgi:hypothetical protein
MSRGKLNKVYVDFFHGDTFLRIEKSDSKERTVVILTDRDKLRLARKLLRGIKLPVRRR